MPQTFSIFVVELGSSGIPGVSGFLSGLQSAVAETAISGTTLCYRKAAGRGGAGVRCPEAEAASSGVWDGAREPELLYQPSSVSCADRVRGPRPPQRGQAPAWREGEAPGAQLSSRGALIPEIEPPAPDQTGVRPAWREASRPVRASAALSDCCFLPKLNTFFLGDFLNEK